jgi:hypothetical protein
MSCREKLPMIICELAGSAKFIYICVYWQHFGFITLIIYDNRIMGMGNFGSEPTFPCFGRSQNKNPKSLIGVGVGAAVALGGEDNYNDDNNQNDEADNDADAFPLFAALVLLLGLFEVLFAFLDFVVDLGDVGLDAVDLLALRHHKNGELVEELHALANRAFQLLDVLKFILDV